MPAPTYPRALERQAVLDELRARLEDLRALTRAEDGTNVSYRSEEYIVAAGRLAEAAAKAAGGEYRRDYNGWTNRETWNTSLWINNDQGTQETAREIVTEALNSPAVDEEYPDWPADMRRSVKLNDAARQLKDWYDDACREQAGALADDYAGPISDAWTYALAVTDWREIVDGLAEA